MQQEEIQRVLARAQEIQSSPDENPNYDELMVAAEEAGVGRNAVLQAIRERLGFAEQPLLAGDYVFALSADGDRHVAEFVSREDDTITVKYINGATAKLLSTAVQPFRMLPGELVDCPWSNLGWRRCAIESYKPENKWVYVVGPGGDKKYFDLDEIRLLSSASWRTRRTSLLIKLALFCGGGAVGALLMWLANR